MIQKNHLDILLIQETKQKIIRSFNKRDYSYTQNPATDKMVVDGKYLSGGLITIIRKDLVVEKDLNNSNKDLLTTNIFLKDGGYIKVINFYANPSRRRKAHKALVKTLKRIRQAEPDIQILVGGDFNNDFTKNMIREETDFHEQLLKTHPEPGMTHIWHNDKESRIDFILTSQSLTTDNSKIEDAPSDHRVLMCTVGGLRPAATKGQKQMIASGTVNDIKPQYIGTYLIYILGLLNLAHRQMPWK